MLSNFKKMLLTAAVVVPAAFHPSFAVAQSSDETFRISNDSHIRIDHVYMTRSSDRVWRSDRLYGYLHPDHYMDLALDPGRYDVKIVDKDGDACVLSNIDVFEGKVWHITDLSLLACEITSSK